MNSNVKFTIDYIGGSIYKMLNSHYRTITYKDNMSNKIKIATPLNTQQDLTYWVQRYWRMSKQLRSRNQEVGLSKITQNYLNQCPVQHTRLRKLVEEYQCQLLTVSVSTPMK